MERSGIVRGRLDDTLQLQSAAALEPLISAISGHHGRPPGDAQSINANLLCGDCQNCADAFLADTVHILKPPAAPWLKSKIAKPLSYWLAGLTVAADWLGSDQSIFSYQAPDLPLDQYWHDIAQPQAQRALTEAGLLPAKPRPDVNFRDLFEIDEPRPMQAAMERLSLPDGPNLVIIEDATGSGKTEAAAFLAQRMMQAGKAGGFFFALPTMATADAMFRRMKKAYRKLFAADAKPSLALAHGRAALSKDFSEVRLLGKSLTASRPYDNEETAAQCAEWIADDRRKTFFADVGAGTIDQALLCILPSKFQTLRLWGLIDRILIVDEAHAYDAYMSKELETLLEFHAAFGGSAIVLSATLPAQKRQSLVTAFVTGCGVKAPDCEAQPDIPYPLVTVASATGMVETERNEIPPAPHTIRNVFVERLGDAASAVAQIATAVEKGAAVAWVRNAVDDAIEAVQLLRANGIDADLFHARFASADRQEIEQHQVGRFGRDGKVEARWGQVLVATQVIEQSLDLDFDLMVSDLAPIDLLIQRAGRLWRHMDKRPAKSRPVAGPKLLVLSPDPGRVTDKNWLHQLGHKGAYVYPNHALLWRTANALFGNNQVKGGGFRAPEDLRPMIEEVYGEPPSDATPEVLRNLDNASDGTRWSDRSLATFNVLKLKSGYSRLDGWLEAEESLISTRLGDRTQVVRLARIENNRLRPWADDPNEIRAWALSELSVRHDWMTSAQAAEPWRAEVDRIREGWPRWQRDLLVAPVSDERQLLLDWTDGTRSVFFYSRKTGLEKAETC